MKSFWTRMIPGIAWFFVLLVLICLPQDNLPKEDWLDKIHFDKVVHFSSFALLTYLFFRPFFKPGHPNFDAFTALTWITVLVVSWGLITELIQYFLIPGRSFDLWDWLFDTLGALAARWFCHHQAKNFVKK